MTRPFDELVVGGVEVAPFVTYAGLAFIALLSLRIMLSVTGLSRRFTLPPFAGLCLYIIIIALLLGTI
jgi:Protein of unknown function (DUF1656)